TALRSLGTSASSFPSRISSFPRTRRFSPIANWNASSRLVFPALFAPTRTVRLSRCTSIFVRDLKSATRIATTFTPLALGGAGATLGAGPDSMRSASVTVFLADFDFGGDKGFPVVSYPESPRVCGEYRIARQPIPVLRMGSPEPDLHPTTPDHVFRSTCEPFLMEEKPKISAKKWWAV